MKQTKVGQFTNSSDYRKHLVSLGYKDYGWQNGWNDATSALYQSKISEAKERCEDIQWNRSGSDCTYAYHDLKIFSSVDMGD